MRCCCAVLVFVLAAAGLCQAEDRWPITQSATRALAQVTAGHPVRDDSAPYLVSGAGLVAAGVTLEILSFTSLRNEAYACAYNFYGFYGCDYEYSTNKPLMFIGLALGVTGGVLLDVGFHKRFRPSIGVGPRRVSLSQQIKF